MTAFTNSEESFLQMDEVEPNKAMGITNRVESTGQMADILPFSVENMLDGLGGKFSKVEDGASHIEVGGNLVAGQNPASSKAAAEAIMRFS